MRHFITTLFVLVLLTFSASDLFADKYPKSNGRSFKPCPVNARMGKRASVKRTTIHNYKRKHTGVKTYTVSSAPARSSGSSGSTAPASGGTSGTDTGDNGTVAPANGDTNVPTTTPVPVNINDQATPVNVVDDVQDVPVNKVQVDQATDNTTTNPPQILPVNVNVDNTTTTNAPVQAVPINLSTVVPTRAASTTATPRSTTTSKPNTTTTTAQKTNVNTTNTSTGNTTPKVQAPAPVAPRAVNAPTSTNSTINNVVPVDLINIQIIHN